MPTGKKSKTLLTPFQLPEPSPLWATVMDMCPDMIIQTVKRQNSRSIKTLDFEVFDLEHAQVFLQWCRGTRNDQAYTIIANCIRNCKGTMHSRLLMDTRVHDETSVNLVIADFDRKNLTHEVEELWSSLNPTSTEAD